MIIATTVTITTMTIEESDVWNHKSKVWEQINLFLHF